MHYADLPGERFVPSLPPPTGSFAWLTQDQQCYYRACSYLRFLSRELLPELLHQPYYDLVAHELLSLRKCLYQAKCKHRDQGLALNHTFGYFHSYYIPLLAGLQLITNVFKQPTLLEYEDNRLFRRKLRLLRDVTAQP